MDYSIKHKILSGGYWVLGCKFVSLFVGLAINSILARLLPPDELGVYFLIFSMVNFLILFSMLGMSRSIVRVTSEAVALELPGRARNAIKYVIQFCTISSLFIAFFLHSDTGLYLVSAFFKLDSLNQVIFFPAVWIVLLTLQRVIVESFRGLNEIKFASIYNGPISRIIIAIVLGIYYLKFHHANINLALTIIIIANLINIIFACIFLLKSISMLGDNTEGTISYTDLIKTSWPLYFTTILLSGFQQSHIWILNYFSIKDSVAVFGAVSHIANLIIASFSVARLVISPIVGRLYVKKKYEDVEKILRTTATVVAVPSIILLLIIIFLSESLLFYLYGTNYSSGSIALRILAIAYLINLLTGTPGVLLVMASKEKFLLMSSVLSGLTGIYLSLTLVETMDYVGVAIGVAVTIVFQNMMMAIYCIRKMSINTFINPQVFSVVVINISHLIFTQIKALKR